jgi:hypothetical protein
VPIAHCPLASKENMVSSWTDKKPLGFWEDYRHMKQKSFDLFCIGVITCTPDKIQRESPCFEGGKRLRLPGFFFKVQKNVADETSFV